jgi:flagellar FliL protein
MAITEERIVSATTLTSATGGQTAQGAAAGEGKTKKPKLKKLLVLVVLVAVAGGAAWFFLLRGDSASAAPKKPEKGAVVPIDPININLADGHYLKLGFALQLKKGAKAELDPSEALSIAIDQLTGQSMERLSKTAERRKAVDTLTTAIEKAYGEEVIGLYPTTLVMQ